MTGTQSGLGARGEEAARAYLAKLGYAILVRNYRVPSGEIDIVAKDGNELVFVEVKTRKSLKYGYPEEAVSFAKEQRIARAIRHYLIRFRGDPAYRVDIISLAYTAGLDCLPEIHHIKGALLRVTV